MAVVKSMTEPHLETAQGQAESDKPSTIRLVIRAEIIPDEPVAAVTQPEWDMRALALAFVGVVVVLALAWIAIGALRSDSNSDELSAPEHASEVAASASPVPSTAPAATSAETSAAHSQSPEAQTQIAVPESAGTNMVPSPIDEVLPTPSRNALQTIRGTIRVFIQVTIDKQGKVVAAESQQAGPSRYFERLSLEAAKQWTFTTTDSEQPRTSLLRFHFTRDGVTGHAQDG
jgi:TonB family protein